MHVDAPRLSLLKDFATLHRDDKRKARLLSLYNLIDSLTKGGKLIFASLSHISVHCLGY